MRGRLTEYVEVATAIRVDGATLGAAGAHVNLVRDFRGDRAAAQRELGRPELRAPSAACFYDPALARHTDALEVSAAELRFGAEMGYTWWRWLLLAAVSAPFVAGCFAAVAAAAAERRGGTVRSIARATAAGGSQPRFAAAPPAAPVATAWPVAPPEPGVALPPAGLYPTFDAPPPPIAQAQPAEPGAVGPVAVAQPVGGGPVAAAQPWTAAACRWPSAIGPDGGACRMALRCENKNAFAEKEATDQIPGTGAAMGHTMYGYVRPDPSLDAGRVCARL